MKLTTILILFSIVCNGQIIDTYKGSHLLLIQQDTFVAIPAHRTTVYNVKLAQCDSVKMDLNYADKEIDLQKSLIDTITSQNNTLRAIKNDNEALVDDLIENIALKEQKINKQETKIKRSRKFAFAGFGVAILEGVLLWLTN